MKKLLQTLLTLTLLAAGSANAVLLKELLDGGSITAGDKLFDNWSLINFEASDASRTLNADNIQVNALNDGGLNPGPGLLFEALNDELSVRGDGVFAFIDLMFGFRVSVLDPTLRIKDNSLELSNVTTNRESDGDNDLGVFILETIGTDAGKDDLGTKDVESSHLDDIDTSKLTDSAAFSPRSEIWVTKNILVWSQDTTDTATLNAFTQRFSQVRVVPEPSTTFLLFASLVMMFTLRAVRRA